MVSLKETAGTAALSLAKFWNTSGVDISPGSDYKYSNHAFLYASFALSPLFYRDIFAEASHVSYTLVNEKQNKQIEGAMQMEYL